MEVSKHDYKKAKDFVSNYNIWDELWHNFKFIDTNILQKRIWEKLRVRFHRHTKEIVDVFYKKNHKSNR